MSSLCSMELMSSVGYFYELILWFM